MKLKPMNPLIQQQIFDAELDFYKQQVRQHNDHKRTVFYEGVGWAIGPTPPTPEAVKKAQFVDKTYVWKNAGIRPRN